MTCKICINKEKIMAKDWFDIDFDGTCDICGNTITFESITVKYWEDDIHRGKRFHKFYTKIITACVSCGIGGKGIKLYCGDWEDTLPALFENVEVPVEVNKHDRN
jgi:hypothetical protein